jgi:peptidoglycan hydrolase-like protein with peptidoglycan-binding domain
MSVVAARLMFLAFIGLTGSIIYNALYLQEQRPHGTASLPSSNTTHQLASETITVEPKTVSNGSARPPQGGPGLNTASTAGADLSVPPDRTGLPVGTSNAGDSLLVVRAVQRELAARGYDVGPVDGQLSDTTRAAISSFQAQEGLAVTGLPSDNLLRQILLGDSVAELGSTGSFEPPAATPTADSISAQAAEYQTIMQVQRMLADLGYAPGPVDGAWGENTASAVTAFQRDRALAETGQITPELLAEFERVTGRDLTITAARP